MRKHLSGANVRVSSLTMNKRQFKRELNAEIREKVKDAQNRAREEVLENVAGRWRSRQRTGRRKLRLGSENKMFLGVCSGIAQYLGIEAWQARLAFLLGLLLIPGVLIVLYFIFWFLLRKEDDFDMDERPRSKKKKKTKPSASASLAKRRPRVALRVVQSDFERNELRLRRIEKFVASGQYELFRGFSDIEKESEQDRSEGLDPR